MWRATFLLLALSTASAQEAPPSRDLLLELTRTPRLAGTPASYRAVTFLEEVLTEAGFEVEVDSRLVLLSLPRRLELSVFDDQNSESATYERVDTFDPDALPPGDLPPFNSWSKSGEVRGEVIDAGWGLEEDFERLSKARIDVAGKVALVRYGRSYRGDKVRLAEAAGCAGVLLFTPPADEATPWPEGKDLPSYEVQRGSIAPIHRGTGDPLTPGFASPTLEAAGEIHPGRWADAMANLPGIPAMPIGAEEAETILSRLATRRVRGEDGKAQTIRLGPGPVSVRVQVKAPRERRPIHNVIATLPGARPEFILAGNHRDAWVRGGNDAGSGTVTLLRAAQRLAERRAQGWTPEFGIKLAFWDAEETGLVGSTEWAEAHVSTLQTKCLAYLNADATVSGLNLRASGTPGLEAALVRALDGVQVEGEPLLDRWMASADGLPRLPLPGAGSDFTAFLHHLNLPILDLGLSGNRAGQYHTAFDDFTVVERYLDPGFVGHEIMGEVYANLLGVFADLGTLAFNDAYAAQELERHARANPALLGEAGAEELGNAFENLHRVIEISWNEWKLTAEHSGFTDLGAFGTWPSFLEQLAQEANGDVLLEGWGEARPRFYGSLEHRPGLPGRPWYRNQMWAPDPDNAYGTVMFPRVRAAETPEEAAAATAELIESVRALREFYEARTERARAARN